MPKAATPYPPGDPRREDLRAQLRTLEAETLHVAFVSRGGAYHLLSYRLEPVRTAWASVRPPNCARSP